MKCCCLNVCTFKAVSLLWIDDELDCCWCYFYTWQQYDVAYKIKKLCTATPAMPKV